MADEEPIDFEDSDEDGYPLPLAYVFDEDAELEDYLSQEEINLWLNFDEFDDINDVTQFLDGLVAERRARGRLADNHLQGAISNSLEVKRIESNYGGWKGSPPSEDGASVVIKHRSLVISSITSCVSFLEAFINEVYDDAIIKYQMESNDEVEQSYQGITETSVIEGDSLEILYDFDKELFGTIQRQISFLQKYQLLLVFGSVSPFNKGEYPYQEVNTLRRLRNYFVHFEPEEWVSKSDEPNIEHKIGSSLQGKFNDNPLAGPSQPNFPHKMLSYGCTKWAILTSVDFADQFCARMNVERSYRHGAIGLEEYIAKK